MDHVVFNLPGGSDERLRHDELETAEILRKLGLIPKAIEVKAAVWIAPTQ